MTVSRIIAQLDVEQECSHWIQQTTANIHNGSNSCISDKTTFMVTTHCVVMSCGVNTWSHFLVPAIKNLYSILLKENDEVTRDNMIAHLNTPNKMSKLLAEKWYEINNLKYLSYTRPFVGSPYTREEALDAILKLIKLM